MTYFFIYALIFLETLIVSMVAPRESKKKGNEKCLKSNKLPIKTPFAWSDQHAVLQKHRFVMLQVHTPAKFYIRSLTVRRSAYASCGNHRGIR